MPNVLLAAGASAALHKSCDLASKLAQKGYAVRTVLTPSAAKLVSPQLFEALTGESAHVDEFSASRGSAMDHIELAHWADCFVVAPATADLVSRLALGLAGDLVGTVSLALDVGTPRLIAPAMNPAMLAARPVQRHKDQLVEDGWRWLAPGEGHMACGDHGSGRLMEPADIVERVAESLR